MADKDGDEDWRKVGLFQPACAFLRRLPFVNRKHRLGQTLRRGGLKSRIWFLVSSEQFSIFGQPLNSAYL